MKLAGILLTASAVGALVAPMTATAATRHHHAAAKADDRAELKKEVTELRAELHNAVEALHQEIAAQRQTETETRTEVAQTQAQVGAIRQDVAAKPAVTTSDVKAEIASAIDTEHKKGYTDFRGLHITPGGYLEMAGIYRQRFQGNDIGSSFSIPFPNNRPGQVSETRLSARQSRLSFLAQGKANATTTLSMYGEFDFLGGAQTANSNESNSYNPRIRNLYATIDWDKPSLGLHVLAGQNWSLVTMNNKGITPRNEVTPPQIDAQYVPGFAWARQPQVRLTADTMDHHLWFAVSAENAATTTVGTVPAAITNTAPAGSGFDAANTLSLNGTPDFVGKVAYQDTVAGHALHLEGFALSRTFTAHVNGAGNENKGGYGFGGGVIFELAPKLLDVQFSGMAGKGIGRYGTSGLPDVTFGSDGSIHPIKETMLLGGATLHATKMLDIYGFAGEELEYANDLGSGYGVGAISGAINNAGCFVEGGACNGNTRRIRQATAGFWDKIYNGSFGKAQVGIQYSYTQRQLFPDAAGNMPQVGESMGFFSIRYYPFSN